MVSKFFVRDQLASVLKELEMKAQLCWSESEIN